MKTRQELEDYITRLEACVEKASALRDQAMLRMTISPIASKAVVEYDVVRALIKEI